jgi:Zn-dependent protease with chaperone function
MTGRHAVRRIELAPAAVVATALALMLVVTVDAVHFHLPALIGGEHDDPDAHLLALLGLLAVQTAVLWRGGRSIARQAVTQRRLRRLPVLALIPVGPHRVAVVGGSEPRAFCAGLLRPRVCVSAPALARLAPAELRAVVEHEACHVRRRDPLRLAIAQVAADGFGFVAPVRRLTARQAAVADLAADAAAVAALGSPRPLAAALLRMVEPAPERVDHLLGRPLRVPHGGLAACALGVLAALGALAVALVVLPADPALPLALLPALGLPALLAFRSDIV